MTDGRIMETRIFGVELDGEPVAGVELTTLDDLDREKRLAVAAIALRALRAGEDVPPPSSERWTVDGEAVPERGSRTNGGSA